MPKAEGGTGAVAQRHNRRDYVRRRQQKKKRRKRAVLLMLAAFLICAAVFYTVLQDHLIFTADGMQFVFSQADGRDTGTNLSGAPGLPQEERDGFYPRTTASVSVESNDFPPYGAGYIDALYLDLDRFTADEIDALAAQLVIDEIDSVVVDIKCDDGRLNYDSDTVFSRTAALDARDGKLEAFLAQCSTRAIRVCGRIACFRDNALPRKTHGVGVLTKDGQLFEDAQGYTWLDPYEADVRAYLAEVCAEAAQLGFREIILDHYSFPGENPDDTIGFSDDADKSEVLSGLLDQLREAAGENMYISAVIYPDVLGEGGSESKGQDLDGFAAVCDRLWIRCSTTAQAESFRLQARAHSPQTEDMLGVIFGERYVSAALIEE